MTTNTADRPAPVDPYVRITSRILEQLEGGVTPWTQPWSADHLAGRVTRPLRVTGEAYQGINVLLLWMEAVAAGHPSPTWMTYQQAQKLGAQVRKGERGTPVVYYGEATRKGGGQGGDGGEPTTDQDGDGEDGRPLRFLKSYTVFNVGQVDGLPERFTPAEAPSPALPGPERIERAEAFFAATGLEVRHGGDRAFYSVKEDRIQLPPIEAFRDAESYYATRGHESVHATRHPSRLDRDLGRKRFGDEGYAREELVAELGSAFLAADLGLALEPRPDHAAYLESWIKVLQDDKRAVVQAASHAERAVRFLHGVQPGRTEAAVP